LKKLEFEWEPAAGGRPGARIPLEQAGFAGLAGSGKDIHDQRDFGNILVRAIAGGRLMDIFHGAFLLSPAVCVDFFSFATNLPGIDRADASNFLSF
jgi:hypothetical protein